MITVKPTLSVVPSSFKQDEGRCSLTLMIPNVALSVRGYYVYFLSSAIE